MTQTPDDPGSQQPGRERPGWFPPAGQAAPGYGPAPGTHADPAAYQGYPGYQPAQDAPQGAPYAGPPGGPYARAPYADPPGGPYAGGPYAGPPGIPYGAQPAGPYGVPYGAPFQAVPGPDPSLAEWWQRLVARLVDGVATGIIMLIAWVPALIWIVSRANQANRQYPDPSQPGAQAAARAVAADFLIVFLLLLALTAAISFAYDWLQHARWGQTLGKRVMSIKVVAAYDRSPVRGGAAASRAAVFALPSLIPLLGGMFTLLDELWLLWDPRRQCLHDKAARTIVIKTNAPGYSSHGAARTW